MVRWHFLCPSCLGHLLDLTDPIHTLQPLPYPDAGKLPPSEQHLVSAPQSLSSLLLS